jgi:MYXO-CTERM domain-containing protein
VSPDRNLLPGDYTLEIEASFDSGVTASAQMALTAPVPDFGFVTSSFRITSTTGPKANEPVSFEVKVTNNGGNVDVNGAFTESIEVRAGGDALGQQSSFITSLKHGEEARVSFVLTPTKGGELEISLEIDSQDEVVEKDEGNNVMLQSLSVEAEPEEEDEGGLIPAPGLLAAAAVLLGAARRRR